MPAQPTATRRDLGLRWVALAPAQREAIVSQPSLVPMAGVDLGWEH